MHSTVQTEKDFKCTQKKKNSSAHVPQKAIQQISKGRTKMALAYHSTGMVFSCITLHSNECSQSTLPRHPHHRYIPYTSRRETPYDQKSTQSKKAAPTARAKQLAITQRVNYVMCVNIDGESESSSKGHS